MRLNDLDDVVSIHLDGPADVEPARHAAARALARRRCRVNLFTPCRGGAMAGAPEVAATILPSLAVRYGIDCRRHKTAEEALGTAMRAVRFALAA